MTPKTVLAAPLTLPNGQTLKHRLAKSAMSEALGTMAGAPTPELNRLYARWAQGGNALGITGNVMIDSDALGEPGNVVIEDDTHAAALKRWAEAGTANGTQLWMQINHPGKQSPNALSKQPVAPSAIPLAPKLAKFFNPPRALTEGEILDLIKRYATTARAAETAGFTGAQIHGAHGYLVSQFLSPLHNQREDDWGGSAEKRMRFVVEVYRAMRAATGKDFAIGIKLNSADFQRGGFTEEESMAVAKALSDEGLDLLEISGGTYEQPQMTGLPQAASKKVPKKASTREREAYFLDYATQVRQHVGCPLMVTGGFRSAEGMAQAVESGEVDVVGLARSLALEPDVPARILAGDAYQSQVKPVQTGIKAIDSMGVMETLFYARQIKRIGKGQNPKPNESPMLAFLRSMITMQLEGRKIRKLRA